MALASETTSVDIQRTINRKRDGFATIRAAASPTGSYVASSHIDCSQASKVTLYFTLVWASATSITYYVEWSHDGTTFFRSINSTAAGGTNTLVANENVISTTASINWVDTVDRQAPYVRVQVKGAGVGADTLKIETHASSL